jgi:hypothetical protein
LTLYAGVEKDLIGVTRSEEIAGAKEAWSMATVQVRYIVTDVNAAIAF